MRLGYLVGTYPAVSHTFIAREVDGLRAAGADVTTMSLRPPDADDLLGEDNRVRAQETLYVQPPRPARVARAQLVAVTREPRGWLSTLVLALRLSPGGLRAGLWHLFYFAEAVLVWSWCRQRGIRHLHAHFANAATTVTLLAAALGRREGMTWSFTMHGPTEFDDVTRFRVAEKVRDAAFVACIGDYARSQLMKLVEPRHWGKLSIVRCGIDPADFLPPPARAADGPLEVLCVGRLVPDKGQELLVRAVAQLRRRGTETRLTLVGDGPDRRAIEALAAELGVSDAVVLAGSVSQTRVRELYREAGAFCLPSFAEGVPVALMEAMATELPVVTTRIMGIPELVQDGVSGMLVAPGRVDDLVRALERLAGDAQLRSALGRAGRARVTERYALAEQVRRLHALFAESAAA